MHSFLSKYLLGMPVYLILEKQEFQGSGVLRFFSRCFLVRMELSPGAVDEKHIPPFSLWDVEVSV